jgi:hypothetical protein
MTNCEVMGAPKLSEKGAAVSNSSSVNAHTAAAASRLLRRKSSSASAFVTSACSRVIGVQLRYNLPRYIRDGRAACDCPRGFYLDGVHAGDVVDDDADRAPVTGRHRRAPFLLRESFGEGGQGGGPLLDAFGK